jgi:hypothetical protein
VGNLTVDKSDIDGISVITGAVRDVGLLTNGEHNNRHELVVCIRGKRCTTRASLFQECAAALQFPDYFGDNWDALEECITDLEWGYFQIASRISIVFIEVCKILVDDERGRNVFFTFLKEAPSMFLENRGKTDRTLQIFLHEEPARCGEFYRLLESFGITWASGS